MADKNLDGNGLSEVWVRAAQLVKKYTGAVDSTKGDLQTQVNGKLSGTDDTKDNTVTFTSADEANPTAWKDVNVLSSNEKHSSILNKISNMFSNIRYLYKNVGGIKGLSSSSAITTQGEYALDAREKNASVEGTLANQISNLNSNLGTKAGKDQISNPNLIDNPFFNVNSRGQSEYTSSDDHHNYIVDRWCLLKGSSAICTVTSDGLSMSYGSRAVFQIIDSSILYKNAGKKLTLSIKTSKQIKSITYTIPSDISPNKNWWGITCWITDGYLAMEHVSGKTYVFISANSSSSDLIINSIKLELGEVSTLNMDTAPNQKVEAIRCMLSTADASDTYANKTLQQPTGDEWDSTYPYVVGDYCIHANQLWMCKADNSGQVPSEGTYWTATSVSSVLKSLDARINALES